MIAPPQAAEAVIVSVQIAPGHDGAAELMVRLRHPNGAEDTVSVDGEIGFRLMRNCGAADLAGLVGQSWRRMMND
jgi:hypothetical protein